jgi:hypothetical protein
MLSRREFLEWVPGLLVVRGQGGKERGTSVHKKERPVESLQQLIQQVRFLEQGVGKQEHIQAIQDQIRVRLLLAGLACVYIEENSQSYICALETSTGCLWCLPLNQSDQLWAHKEFEKIGLKGLENRIGTLSRACDI